MDSPKLRRLTRTQLQSLAKVGTLAPSRTPPTDTNYHVSQREVIRAVGKTEDIIRRLMRKHPRGVPVPEYVFPRIITYKFMYSLNWTSDTPTTHLPHQHLRNKVCQRDPARVLHRYQKLPKSVRIPKVNITPCLWTLRQQLSLTIWSSPLGKGELIAETVSPSPSSSSEALEQLLYPEGK